MRIIKRFNQVVLSPNLNRLAVLLSAVLVSWIGCGRTFAVCTPPPAGLVGWWQAEGNATDLITGSNGVIYSGTSFAPGEAGQGFSFNGGTACIMNTNTPPLTNVQNTFTMEFWANPQRGITLQPEGGGYATSGQNYAIFPDYGGVDGTKAGAGVSVGTNGICVIEHADGYIPSLLSYTNALNGWVHVAVVYTNKQPLLYVNGVKVRTGVPSTKAVVYPSKNFGNAYGNSLWLTYGPYLGLLDEVSLYNRALASDEIAAVYQADGSGKCFTPTPPVITSQPVSRTNIAGSTASFSVQVAGTSPFSYLWSFNGTAIPNATNASLTLTNVQMEQGGNYTVQLSNSAGSTNSANAVLTVILPTPCYPAPSGLVGWWQAEGSAGDLISGSNGVIYSGTAFASGEVGQGFSFNGSTACIMNTNTPPLTNVQNTFTMEFWALPQKSITLLQEGVGFGTGGENYAIFPDFGGIEGTKAGAGVSVGTNGICVVEHSDGYMPAMLTYTSPLNGWVHVAVVYTNRQPSLYVNGLKVRTGVTSAKAVVYPSKNLGNAYGNSLWLGYGPYLGLLDEVSIYNRALASDEIAAIYLADGSGKCFTPTPPAITTQPASRTNTVGSTASFSVQAAGTMPFSYEWNFNGTGISNATNASLILTNVQFAQAGSYRVRVSNAAGSTNSADAVLTVILPPPCYPAPSGLVGWWQAEGGAGDLIGGGNGTIYSGTAFASGEVGQCFSFNGSTACVMNTNTPPLTNIQNTFTMEFWAYPQKQIILLPEGGGAGTSGQNYAIFPDYGGTDGKAGVGVSVGTNGVCVVEHKDGSMPSLLSYSGVLNGWVHVAVVYSNKQPALYVNGAKVRTGVTSTRTYVYPSKNLGNAYGNSLWLGYGPYLGLLDEVSIYNRALTSNEIAAIHQADGSGKCPPPPTIVQQPASQSVLLGDSVTLAVVATGSQPLVYQWNRNSSPLGGATNSSLLLANIQLAHAGSYSVTVSNLVGDATSTNAVLTVLTPECTDAPPGLVAWWTGEATVADSVGTNIATLQNGLTFSAGKVGQGFSFDGVNDFATVPASPSLNVGLGSGMTVECWVNPAQITTAKPLVEWDATSDGAQLWLEANGRIFANFKDTSGVPHTLQTATGLMQSNALQHVASTYDKASGAARLYRNGVVVAATNLGTFTPQTTYALNIGKRTASVTGNGIVFKGILDEVSLYNRALTTNELAAIYGARGTGKCPLPPTLVQQPASQSVFLGDTVPLAAAAVGTPPISYQWYHNSDSLAGETNRTLILPEAQLAQAGNYSIVAANSTGTAPSSNAVLTVTAPDCVPAPDGLVAWWSGDGDARDNVGTNNGILQSGVTFAAGKAGQSFALASSNNGVHIPASAALNVGVADGMTIECWVKLSTVTGNNPLVEWNDGVDTGGLWGVHLHVGPFGAGTLYANVVGPGETWHQIHSAAGVVKTNVFQHVALTYDRPSGVARLFYNGITVAEQSIGSFTPLTDNDLYLGKRPAGDIIANSVGLMDEVSIYNRALGTNEIAAIYGARGAGKCPLPPTLVSVAPTSAVLNEGAAVTFTASAIGSSPLRYQWQLGGSDLAGETNASLTLSNVVYAQGGTYTIVVSNSIGTASSNVLLRVNRAPIADAGATDPLLISPNGSNAVAVLDGSHSSDPDGDALNYAWFVTGETNAFATGVVAVTTLPLGANNLTLRVSDGLAEDSQAFAVEVITMSEGVERLAALVADEAANPNPLLASLRAALASIDRSQPATAINQLEAFKNKVLAQVAPVDPDLANQLLADAQAIIDALNGGGAAAAVALEITSISQGNNGKSHLKIKGAAGRVHIVETSTDMANWVKVGVAGCCGGCDYEFNDTQSSTTETRFYRVVSPK